MKCLLKLLAVAVLLVLLLVGGLIFMINPLIETAVTRGVSYATHQETTLDSADLGIFSGRMALEGLEIANPPGFQETPLFKLGRFETALGPTGMTSEVIELDLVELDGLDLALELKGSETNVTQLVERLQELQEQLKKARGVQTPGEPSGGDEPTEPLPEEAGPALNINRIRVAGIKGSLRISEIPLVDGVYAFEVPALELENFSSDMDGASMVEWTAHVLESVVGASLAAAELELPEDVRKVMNSSIFKNDVLGSLLEGGFDDIDDKLEESAKKELDEYLEKAKQDPAGETKKALDKLDGLFGGKD